MPSDYDQLLDLYRDVAIASSISSTLYWDRETGKLPEEGTSHRSYQMSYLTRQQEQFWRSEKTAKLLDELSGQELDPIPQRNVDIIRRKQAVKTAIPEELVVKRVEQSNQTNAVWKKAKAKADFSIVEDELNKLFEINHDYAHRLASIKGIDDPFDALIDERDEGLTSDIIRSYFDQAKSFLVPFLEKNKAKSSQKDDIIRNISLTKVEEKLVIEYIADLFNYPYEGEGARGHIDEVEHPLTITCGPDDVRVTIKHGNYLQAIESMNHELGHAMHHLGKNRDWDYTPINYSTGPSIGECLSRFTENKIGKTFEFMLNIHPKLNEISSYKLKDISPDQFFDAITLVKPGPKRTAADEVSYGLHIIIRFELEQLLFNDQLTISELPQAWNEKYEKYLGVEVPNATHGVLQDLHWYTTYWGYFHGYFMGDLMGSQIYYTMIEQVPDYYDHLSAGNLRPLLEWMTQNIYRHGGRYPALDLVQEVTGEELDVKYFERYIRQKYSE